MNGFPPHAWPRGAAGRWIYAAAAWLAASVCAFGAGADPPSAIPLPLPTPIRGMTISSHAAGGEWATPAMAATLDDLKSLGVNCISIHPYAQLQDDGSVVFPREAAPDYLAFPLEQARARGLGVMLIPHIAYWDTKFSWRGKIRFRTDAGWERFFADYKTWIVHMARVAQAHGAGLLCIGLEFNYAQRDEARWREIIAAVRAVYRGKLTYGGNWDTYAQIRFYDALDYVGVLGYFPLCREPDPSLEQVAAGWPAHLARLRAFAALAGKPVLFVEIGYNESARAAAQPWAYFKRGSRGREIQRRCLEAALRLESTAPDLAGMFFWKWFPPSPDEPAETFDLRTPEFRALLARYWSGKTGPARAAGSP